MTRRIGVTSADEIQKVLQEFKKDIKFKSRGVTFGEVDFLYRSKEITEKMTTRKLQSEDWVLIPAYIGRRMVRVRVGTIPPEIEKE